MKDHQVQMYLVRYRVSTDQKYGMFLCAEHDLPQKILDCARKNDVCRLVIKKQK